ncbi:MAG: SGNH hydrolase family [uncultured Acidimicrobiales bacterium]|uniref:SGNH hydrolase family n=1 Tax=uncultured Acidimicrobiales bacterium TaxID=310071 RepID=A0A6J4IP40_9ACTN|nr:MAG: SGNH hydrolase family [uncultured Acidimicrobiales bacterium]
MSVRRRRLLLVAASVPVVVVAVLGVEVELARRGDRLAAADLSFPAEGPRTAVWLGDSTAAGVGVTDGDDAVASVVGRSLGQRVEMLAVSGATLAEVVDEQLPAVAALRPDVVYVSVGANDVTHLTKVGDFERRYGELLDALPAGVPVQVLGVPDMGAPPRLLQPLRAIAGWRGRRLDGVVRRAAAEHDGATYVDIAGPTGPPFRRDPDRYFADDGYHPSAAGYRLWADAVLATTAG